MKKFPKFWYESNACWGWVESIEDLQEKIDLQTNPLYGGLKTADEVLDRSRQNNLHGEEILDFGTRMEHKGKQTLRQFLIENEVDLSKIK